MNDMRILDPETKAFLGIAVESIALGVSQPIKPFLCLARNVLLDRKMPVESKRRFIRHLLVQMKPVVLGWTNYANDQGGSIGYMVDHINEFIDEYKLEEDCVEKLGLG